jgi:hypothetical protein
MPAVDEAVVTEITERGETLDVRGVIGLLERYHTESEPGVSRERVEAYTAALDDQPDFEFEPDTFRREVEERSTEAEHWAGSGLIYDLGDRLSSAPARWHAELGGETDPVAYLAFIDREVTGYEGGTAGGVPEDRLADLIASVGRVDRDQALKAIETARADGRITEGPDQHPSAGVRLAEGMTEDGG